MTTTSAQINKCVSSGFTFQLLCAKSARDSWPFKGIVFLSQTNGCYLNHVAWVEQGKQNDLSQEWFFTCLFHATSGDSIAGVLKSRRKVNKLTQSINQSINQCHDVGWDYPHIRAKSSWIQRMRLKKKLSKEEWVNIDERFGSMTLRRIRCWLL